MIPFGKEQLENFNPVVLQLIACGNHFHVILNFGNTRRQKLVAAFYFNQAKPACAYFRKSIEVT